MALKLKFTAREEIPAEQQSLYVARDGAWHLDVEAVAPMRTENPHPAFGHPLPSDGRGAEKPREQWTIRDEMAARETHVAQVRLESDVRQAARQHGASAKALEDLRWKIWFSGRGARSASWRDARCRLPMTGGQCCGVRMARGR